MFCVEHLNISSFALTLIDKENANITINEVNRFIFLSEVDLILFFHLLIHHERWETSVQ